MAIAPGTRLGPYEIVEPIGAGGIGEIYRATDTRVGRTVAIKELPGHLAENPECRERFEREAKAVAALSHPNLCALFDFGEESGTSFLVMEHLEGETLFERLKRGPLPVGQAVDYVVEIAQGLNAAHGVGIVPPVLKPADVILTKSGAKLLNFGLGRPAEGDPAEAGANIHALGAVLYEMVTGRKPSEDAIPAATQEVNLAPAPTMEAPVSFDAAFAPDTPSSPRSGDTPSGDTPSGDTPSGDTPSGDTPSSDTPSSDTPSSDTPSSDTPSSDTPSSDTPSSDTPSSDTPSSDTPSSDTPSATPSIDVGTGRRAGVFVIAAIVAGALLAGLALMSGWL